MCQGSCVCFSFFDAFLCICLSIDAGPLISSVCSIFLFDAGSRIIFCTVYILFRCVCFLFKIVFLNITISYYLGICFVYLPQTCHLCNKTQSYKLVTARKREELLLSKEAELTVMQEQLETAKEELLRREAELDRRSSELAHVQVRLLQRFRTTTSRNLL